jgi:hypothetical protein
MPRIETFPQPVASNYFYASFCLIATVNSPEPLNVLPGASRHKLELENADLYSRYRAYSSRRQKILIAAQLKSVLLSAFDELGLHAVPYESAQQTEQVPYVQAYITGPVEDDGVEDAKGLGWLRGEPPLNPYNDDEFLAKTWRHEDAHRFHGAQG